MSTYLQITNLLLIMSLWIPSSFNPESQHHKKSGSVIKQKLLNAILSPTVLGVLITAIVGPIAVVKVNENLENKKLQKDVITTVLNHANAADFSKVEALERISIIAKMVDENKEVFGLSFTQTDSTFQNLFRVKKEFGITQLNRELQTVEASIADMVEESDYLDKQIEVLEEQKKTLITRGKAVKDKVGLLEIDIQLTKRKREKELCQNQLTVFNKERIALERGVKEAEIKIQNVIEESEKNAKELERYKQLIAKNKDASEVVLALEETSAKFKQLQVVNNSMLAELREAQDSLRSETKNRIYWQKLSDSYNHKLQLLARHTYANPKEPNYLKLYQQERARLKEQLDSFMDSLEISK